MIAVRGALVEEVERESSISKPVVDIPAKHK